MRVTSGRPEGKKHYFTLIYGSHEQGVKPVMPKENLEMNLKACMTQLLQKRWAKGIESWNRPDSEPQNVYLFAELGVEHTIVGRTSNNNNGQLVLQPYRRRNHTRLSAMGSSEHLQNLPGL